MPPRRTVPALRSRAPASASSSTRRRRSRSSTRPMPMPRRPCRRATSTTDRWSWSSGIGGFAALLTGDAEAPVEAMLVERRLLPAGRRAEGRAPRLDLVDARPPCSTRRSRAVAVISAGEGNEYGHPAPETLGDTRRPTRRWPCTGPTSTATSSSSPMAASYRVRTDAGWSAVARRCTAPGPR